ncbi:hypothetical protein B566_EDAN017635 [Ephemera danica]|nr:hypothetical protein B566_EDAN017635 [Ephemera danica]
MYQLMAFQLGALNEGFSTLGTNVDSGAVSVQVFSLMVLGLIQYKYHPRLELEFDLRLQGSWFSLVGAFSFVMSSKEMPQLAVILYSASLSISLSDFTLFFAAVLHGLECYIEGCIGRGCLFDFTHQSFVFLNLMFLVPMLQFPGGHFDIAVVGAGVEGSWTALQLSGQTRRKSVVILDQFPVLHSRGSSHGQSRIIRLAYAERFHAELMPRAFREWRQLERDTGRGYHELDPEQLRRDFPNAKFSSQHRGLLLRQWLEFCALMNQTRIVIIISLRGLQTLQRCVIFGVHAVLYIKLLGGRVILANYLWFEAICLCFVFHGFQVIDLAEWEVVLWVVSRHVHQKLGLSDEKLDLSLETQGPNDDDPDFLHRYSLVVVVVVVVVGEQSFVVSWNKLEYAGHLTASTTQWKKLETMQNKFLRLILGAFRSTPITVLLLEAGALHLKTRFQLLGEKFLLRKLSLTKHPLTEQTNLLYQKTHPATGYWAKQTSHYLPQAGLTYSTSKLHFDKTQHYRYSYTPSKLSVCARNLPNISLTHFQPKPFLSILMALKSGKNVGCGFYSPQCQLSKGFKLPELASIFTAEAFAIHIALLHFYELTQGNLTFLSDSRAVLLALQSQFSQTNNNWIIREIKKNLRTLTKRGIAMKLVCIPGHCILPGNDKADKIAKEAASSKKIHHHYNTVQSIFNASTAPGWDGYFTSARYVAKN